MLTPPSRGVLPNSIGEIYSATLKGADLVS